MTRFGAVIFDLYETLITEFDPHWRPRPTPAEQLGIPAEVFERVWRARQRDRMTSALDFRDVLREACRAAGVPPDPRTVESLDAERRATKARSVTTADAEVVGALRELRASGLRLGVVSNCAVEEVAGWPDSPYRELFDDVVFSFRAGVAKPDRAIYRLACRNLGTPPGRTAFVGDGGSDELAGAEAAGLTAFRARWFIDRWPPEIRRHHPIEGFPTLTTPAATVRVLNQDR
ncbi:HAD family hydrolase [Microlunatus sp. GCM10028923]|uniref:HAD family hydrolase n=1 Tax=Microlunatus sp. GCM10028923 TaxID=3273400 RepID=UPI00360CD25C